MIDENTQPFGRTLGAIAEQVDHLQQVRKTELSFGDRVLVTTLNSTYLIHVLEDGLYSISGGWVDSQGLSPGIYRYSMYRESPTVCPECEPMGSPRRIDRVKVVVPPVCRETPLSLIAP